MNYEDITPLTINQLREVAATLEGDPIRVLEVSSDWFYVTALPKHSIDEQLYIENWLIRFNPQLTRAIIVDDELKYIDYGDPAWSTAPFEVFLIHGVCGFLSRRYNFEAIPYEPCKGYDFTTL